MIFSPITMVPEWIRPPNIMALARFTRENWKRDQCGHRYTSKLQKYVSAFYSERFFFRSFIWASALNRSIGRTDAGWHCYWRAKHSVIVQLKCMNKKSHRNEYCVHFIEYTHFHDAIFLVCIPLGILPHVWMHVNEFDVTHYFWVGDSVTQSSG